MRRIKWRIGGAVILVAFLGWLRFERPSVAPQVYEIGWSESPPFQVRGADGQPTGLAVDLVRTAAQRRGIRLHWVYWADTPDSALRGKKVDLWPLVTVIPERLQYFHISSPYLEAEYCLLVRAESSHVKMQDLATATIGFANVADAWQLEHHLPHARSLPHPYRWQVMEDLCRQRSDAAFMDAFTGISTLMERSACGEQALRWIAAPEIRSKFGIGSTFASRGAADALRDEIGGIAAEGKLAPILGQWGYMSQELESIEELLDARRHEQRLAAAAVLFALLFVLACWQSVRILRERNRTRHAEQALRETEQRLRLMANNIKEMVLAYDMDRHLIFANRAVETLTGYQTAELEKSGFVNWIHPDDQARMLTHWERLFQGSAFVDEEYRLTTRDGRTKWASATWGPIRDEAGRQIGVQGSERDITDRKLADVALRESERRFREMLETTHLVSAMLDQSGNITFCNDFLLRLTGWKRDEVMGRNWCDLFIPPGQYDKQLFSTQVSDRAVPPHHENEIITKTGGRRMISWNNTILFDAARNPIGVATIGEDVSERIRLENEVRQAQKLESVGRLAGGVAHDFNNLLTVINGYSDFLLKQLKTSDPLRSYAEQIRNAGDRAASLTKQLLAFSRKQIIEPRVLDLNATIRESTPMLQRLIGEDMVLETHLFAPLGQVMADPDQIHQVIMNLVVNARDAMPDGGKLDIQTGNVDLDATSSAAMHDGAAPGRFVLMTVTDTGHGMDEATRQRIFEPFFTTKEIGRGTGLGLATVYGIIRQSGGWIDVSSEVGIGTSFKIYLPRIDASRVPEEHKIAAATGGAGETVLLVEDQEAVRSLAGAALKQYGYRVIEASDGDEAIAVAEQYLGEIHLLLTDVVMPGMDGKDLSKRLKKVRPNLKVLFTSGYTADVIAHRGVVERGVPFLHKPFSPEELAVKIRDVLADLGG